MVKQSRRAGFAHNHALPWLALLGIICAFLVPVLRRFKQDWAIGMLLVALVLVGLVTIAGEIELYRLTRHRKHLLLPFAYFIGFGYLVFGYLSR